MKTSPLSFARAAALMLALCGVEAAAGTASNVTGLYYTGVNNSGGLLSNGAQDSHWTVTYSTEGNQYQGSSYVVGSSYMDSGWVPNSSVARWIVPPGSRTSSDGNSSTANLGGTYQPGNGTTGTNAASYVYTLAFNIAGSGSGTVTNNVSISLTIAADDQAKIYINPVLNGNGSINTSSSTAAASLFAAWGNTTAITLQNYGSNKNVDFVVGTNYLVIQVDNTNSLTGSVWNDPLNPSGLLVYQIGAVATIDGNPVPEAGTWLPVLGGLAFFAWRRFKRSGAGEVSVQA